MSGMSENLEYEEIIDLIKTQNEGIPGKCIKILGRYENKSFKYQKYYVLMEVDSATALYFTKKIRFISDLIAV